MELTNRIKKVVRKNSWVEIECLENCAGYYLLKANTPKSEQVCPGCGGPIAPSGDDCVWPDLVMLDDFLTNPEAKIIHYGSKDENRV